MVHKRRDKKYYNNLEEEATSNNEPHVLIVYGFYENLSIPQIHEQEILYLRQITVNVFSIHDKKENTAIIYIYHEGTANKTSNVVCSFLYDYYKNILREIAEF